MLRNCRAGLFSRPALTRLALAKRSLPTNVTSNSPKRFFVSPRRLSFSGERRVESMLRFRPLQLGRAEARLAPPSLFDHGSLNERMHKTSGRTGRADSHGLFVREGGKGRASGRTCYYLQSLGGAGAENVPAELVNRVALKLNLSMRSARILESRV